MQKPNNAGKYLSAKRKSANLTQADLAQRLGYKSRNGQVISNIERGIAPLPWDMIAPVCKLFIIPEDEVINAILADYRQGMIDVVNRSVNE